MEELIQFLQLHSIRGACQCGGCIDAPAHPETEQPKGHTADLVFFKVAAQNDPDVDALKKLITEHKQGAFCNVDLFDGKEHGYLELGGWIGDQGYALCLMGLGTVMGLWTLLTPRTVLGDSVTEDLAMKMAGMGYITIQATA